MSELVLDKLLNRYLLMSLRANLDNNDSVFKTKQVCIKKEVNVDCIEQYLCPDCGSVAEVVAAAGLARDGQDDDVHEVRVWAGRLPGAQQGGRHRDREDCPHPRRLRDRGEAAGAPLLNITQHCRSCCLVTLICVKI